MKNITSIRIFRITAAVVAGALALSACQRHERLAVDSVGGADGSDGEVSIRFAPLTRASGGFTYRPEGFDMRKFWYEAYCTTDDEWSGTMGSYATWSGVSTEPFVPGDASETFWPMHKEYSFYAVGQNKTLSEDWVTAMRDRIDEGSLDTFMRHYNHHWLTEDWASSSYDIEEAFSVMSSRIGAYGTGADKDYYITEGAGGACSVTLTNYYKSQDKIVAKNIGQGIIDGIPMEFAHVFSRIERVRFDVTSYYNYVVERGLPDQELFLVDMWVTDGDQATYTFSDSPETMFVESASSYDWRTSGYDTYLPLVGKGITSGDEDEYLLSLNTFEASIPHFMFNYDDMTITSDGTYDFSFSVNDGLGMGLYAMRNGESAPEPVEISNPFCVALETGINMFSGTESEIWEEYEAYRPSIGYTYLLPGWHKLTVCYVIAKTDDFSHIPGVTDDSGIFDGSGYKPDFKIVSGDFFVDYGTTNELVVSFNPTSNDNNITVSTHFTGWGSGSYDMKI